MSWLRSAALGLIVLAASPVSGKSIILQTVDLTDRNLSAEGSEAKLYQILPAGECRIETIFYGEGGRVAYGFEFGSHLRSATEREYHYKVPWYIPPDERQVVSVHSTTLKNAAGRRSLPTEFETEKAYFKPELLADCVTKRR
jgi:hypothetical protein